MKIYLAGDVNEKPKEFNWRNELIGDIWYEDEDEDGIERAIFQYHTYIGPFLHTYKHEGDALDLVTHCCEQIKRADVLFAWLGKQNMSGTLTEIGYAKGLGKLVLVGGSNKEFFYEAWFPRYLATDFSPDPTDSPSVTLLALLRANTKFWGFDTYSDYLKSDHWQKIRKEALEYYGPQCVVCEDKKRLAVHHKNYNCLGEELMRDVIILCQSCHDKFHDVVKPTEQDNLLDSLLDELDEEMEERPKRKKKRSLIQKEAQDRIDKL